VRDSGQRRTIMNAATGWQSQCAGNLRYGVAPAKIVLGNTDWSVKTVALLIESWSTIRRLNWWSGEPR
jgi:hypothetical protein